MKLNDIFYNAVWISDGVKFDEKSNGSDERALYFRRRFTLKTIDETAKLYVCGLGLYEAKINGARVGDKVLDPAFTDYSKRVLYSVYDVGALLRRGENEIEVVVGNGWYNQTTHDVWKFWKKPWRDRAKLLAAIVTETAPIVVTDEGWECGYGAIRVRGFAAAKRTILPRKPNIFPQNARLRPRARSKKRQCRRSANAKYCRPCDPIR